jgi:hypothetical protein
MIDKLKSYIKRRSGLQQAKSQTAEALRHAIIMRDFGGFSDMSAAQFDRVEEAHRIAHNEYDSFEAKHFDLEQCLTELTELLVDYQ